MCSGACPEQPRKPMVHTPAHKSTILPRPLTGLTPLPSRSESMGRLGECLLILTLTLTPSVATFLVERQIHACLP